MTKTTAEGTAAAGIEQGRFSVPGWLVIVVALAILVAYAVFSYSMLDYSKGNADHWDRALLIFRSVEALAFAAAGAVLGVQIQRSQVRETEHRLQQAHTEYGKRSQGAKKAVADAREASESLDSLASDEDGGSEGASQTYRGPADRVILKNLQTTIDAIL